MSAQNTISDIYHRLFAHFGPQHWWPADSELEIMVGAILVQNTNWTNVSKAITCLRDQDMLNFQTLVELSLEQLAELIRSSGYHSVKAKRLKNLLTMIQKRYAGSLQALLDDDPLQARRNLLDVSGVGEETADSILLYAGRHPVFVIDTYTHRILYRHYLAAEETSYQELQEMMVAALPTNTKIYNEYHALLVAAGKQYCRKSSPRCLDCPLQELPHAVE